MGRPSISRTTAVRPWKEALTLAARRSGQTSNGSLPVPVVKAVAWVDGALSALRGKVPDLEVDAVNYLYDDYVVDNTKLRETGFVCEYPDFEASIRQLGEAYLCEGKSA